MSFFKSTVAATVSAAVVLASVSMPTVAYARKGKHFHGHHHHHHHNHKRKYYRYGVGAVGVIGGAAYYDCRKWKYRYKRTGNPYYLDRYYACKY